MSLRLGDKIIAGITDTSNFATKAELNTKADISSIISILNSLYPVGSIYIGTQSTCPLSTLISGSVWELVSGGRVLQGSDSSHTAGSIIAAGLPNITGTIKTDQGWKAYYGDVFSGALGYAESRQTYVSNGNSYNRPSGINFNARSSNSIYGNSSTVQPPAYVVNIWRRKS